MLGSTRAANSCQHHQQSAGQQQGGQASWKTFSANIPHYSAPTAFRAQQQPANHQVISVMLEQLDVLALQ
jgi:hypothetical protein